MVDELRLSEHRTDDKKRNGELSKKAGAFAEQSGMDFLFIIKI